MRITDSMMRDTALLNQSRAAQNLATLSQEAGSGNLISAPSDNPAGFSELVSIDSRLTIMQGRPAAVTAAGSNLDTASSALSSATDILSKAKQLALVAASGTYDAQSRADAATQVQGLVQQMITLANTQGTDGYLFGGTKTSTPPFDAAGNFLGNNGVTQVEVADGVLVNSNASGADAFTSAGGGSNVIQDMQTLVTALSTNNVAGITASIGQMDADHAQVNSVMVQAGSASASLQTSAQLIGTLTTATETARSNLDNAGTPQVYSELQATQTAYQASLAVTQQVLSLQAFTGKYA